ncbi:hypothetical protein N8459_01160 [Nitrosopumilus sp.]|jgi:hypothetical protein|nr:hypothetical protein [Nitrosopumilus sp.]
MSEDPLEAIILQTINGALSTVPGYLEEIKQNNDTLKVKNAEDFVYGIVMGVALGMTGAILSSQEKPPTVEDQMRVRDMIYKHIPEIRERIFS